MAQTGVFSSGTLVGFFFAPLFFLPKMTFQISPFLSSNLIGIGGSTVTLPDIIESTSIDRRGGGCVDGRQKASDLFLCSVWSE